MPTMSHPTVGSVIPPRCLACLLLVLCLLPAVVPAAEGGGASGAATGAGEPRDLMEHRLTGAERRRAEEQAARTVEASHGASATESLGAASSGTTWQGKWEQRQREKKEMEANEPNPNVEAAKGLLFVVVMGYSYFLYCMFVLPERLAYSEGKIPKIRWVEDDGGPPREEEGDAIPKKILEEYPEEIRDRLVVIYRCMPFWLKLGKLLARKWRAWQGIGMDNPTAPSAGTAAQGQASPPAASPAPPPVGRDTNRHADWLRQRRRRKDKTD